MELKLEIADAQNLSILLRKITEDSFPNRSALIRSIDDQIRDNICIRFPTEIVEIDLYIMSFIPDIEWRYVLLVNKSTLSLLNKDYLWRPKIEKKFGYDFGLSLGHSYMNFYYRLSLTKKSFFKTAVDYSIIPLIKFILPLVPDYNAESDDEESYYLIRAINEKNIDVIIEIFKRDDSDDFDEILQHLLLPNEVFYNIFDIISNKDRFIQRAKFIINDCANLQHYDYIDTRLQSLFVKYPMLKLDILSTAIHISTLKKWTRERIRNLDTKEILALCSGDFDIGRKKLAYLFKIYRERDAGAARKLLEQKLINTHQNIDIMYLKSLGDLGKIKYIRKIIDNRLFLHRESAERDIAIIVGLMKRPKIHRLASLAKEKNMVLFFYKLLKDDPKVINYVSAGCFSPIDKFHIIKDTIGSEDAIAGDIIFSDEWISTLGEEDVGGIFNRTKQYKLGKYHILIFRYCIKKKIPLSLRTVEIASLSVDTEDTSQLSIAYLLVRYVIDNWDRYKTGSYIIFPLFERIVSRLRYVKWIIENDCFRYIFPLLFKNMSTPMINRSLAYILEEISTLSDNQIKNIWETLFVLDFSTLDSFASDLLAKRIIDEYEEKSKISHVLCSIISKLRPKLRYIKWIFDKGLDCYSLIYYSVKKMKEDLLLRCNRLARSRGVLKDFYMCLDGDTVKIIFNKLTDKELYELLPNRKNPFSSREKLLMACYKEFWIVDE